MISRRRFIGLGASAVFASPLFGRWAHAQSWPARPVRLVLGLPGALDAVGRVVADRLSVLWGQPVVVEGKLGAGGNLAAEAVARSNADGYTILLAGTPLAVNRYLFDSIAYDPVVDFAPVTLISLQPNVMLVPNSSPAHSVAEFIAHAKANHGKITFASAGHGTSVHLCGELFKRVTGIEMTHVSYRQLGGLLTDLVAGRVDAAFPVLATGLPLMRGGQARALAVSAAKRVSIAPELPTFAEAGVPGVDDVALWFGFFVPARTPAGIVSKIHADTVAALADPFVKERLGQLAVTPVGSTPAELAIHLKSEMERWAPIIKESKIRIDA
jgi:tripartite-type tricarboxylate transporter receptor subunit TctC